MKSIIYQGRVLAVPRANGEFIFSHLPDPDPDPDPGLPHKCVWLNGKITARFPGAATVHDD